MKHPDDDRISETGHLFSNQFDDTKVADDVSDRSSTLESQYNCHSTGQAVADHRPSGRPVPPVRHEMTMDKEASRPVDNRGPGFRFRASEPPPSDHQRDSSPINRLAGLFKNFAKF